jgi:hypothetical protein
MITVRHSPSVPQSNRNHCSATSGSHHIHRPEDLRPHDNVENQSQFFKHWLAAKLLLSLASRVTLGSESHKTQDHILRSHGSLKTELESESESEPELLYDWWFTTIQFFEKPFETHDQ